MSNDDVQTSPSSTNGEMTSTTSKELHNSFSAVDTNNYSTMAQVQSRINFDMMNSGNSEMYNAMANNWSYYNAAAAYPFPYQSNVDMASFGSKRINSAQTFFHDSQSIIFYINVLNIPGLVVTVESFLGLYNEFGDLNVLMPAAGLGR